MRSTTAPKRRFFSFTVAAALSLAATTAAASVCYDFEGPPAGTSFVFGDVWNGVHADIEFRRFQEWDGTWNGNGYAEYSATNGAGGSPSQELIVNHIMVRVIPDTPATSATYRYGDYGGNVNFGVNGDFRNVDDFIDLDGTVVGGFLVSVTESVTGTGEVTLTPDAAGNTLERFGFGGVELVVDDVCFD